MNFSKIIVPTAMGTEKHTKSVLEHLNQNNSLTQAEKQRLHQLFELTQWLSNSCYQLISSETVINSFEKHVSNLKRAWQ